MGGGAIAPSPSGYVTDHSTTQALSLVCIVLLYYVINQSDKTKQVRDRHPAELHDTKGKSLSAVFLYDTLFNKISLFSSANLSRIFGYVKNDVLQN